MCPLRSLIGSLVLARHASYAIYTLGKVANLYSRIAADLAPQGISAATAELRET